MKSYTLGQSKHQVLELIPEKHIRLVQLGALRVCISRIGENFFAFEPFCPHQNTALHKGFVTGQGEVVCPLHEYRFDLSSGQVRVGQCPDLKIYHTDLTPEGLTIFI